ncbi:MAG TPA: hypothetical protein VK642_14145 [Burkholderiales bacterium]|nr:hypothetical protein [Burkholderiales bacterium]
MTIASKGEGDMCAGSRGGCCTHMSCIARESRIAVCVAFAHQRSSAAGTA